jgi:hypothetical protein
MARHADRVSVVLDWIPQVFAAWSLALWPVRWVVERVSARS